MRLIVTGAAGVLGSELIEQTPQAEIVAVTRQPQALTRRWQGYANMKCCSWDELAQMPLADGDVIVHGAFPRQENGQELTEALDLTGTLLKKAGTSGKEIAWVDISSRSVYGQNEQTPWTETAELMPASPYALAKAAQELLTRQAAEAYGFRYTVLRMAGLIGVGMEARLVSQMTMRAIHDRALTVMGGEQQFSMLDIRDAAAGIRALLRKEPTAWRPLYNFGAEQATRLKDIAPIIQKEAQRLYGWRGSITQKRDAALIDEMDSSLFYAQMGWRPQYTLADTVDWLLETYTGAAK
mgnify:CR=1 FL=1